MASVISGNATFSVVDPAADKIGASVVYGAHELPVTPGSNTGRPREN
jgi:hypothetical protein